MPSVAFRRAAPFVCGLALLASQPAHAEDVVEACASASERAQALRDDGALIAAREALITCAAARCPGIVRQDCTTWLEEVERSLPTVVVTITDAEGRDVVAAEIAVDGEVRADASLGQAFAVNPGKRELVIVLGDRPAITERIVVAEGTKDRRITLTIDGVDGAGAEGVVPVGAWILGGVGLAGIGVFAGLAAYASSEVDDMRATCAPNCPQERVDDAQRVLVGANVSLGVGLAAIGAAVTWTLVHALAGEDPPPDVAITPFGIVGRF